MNSPQTVSKLLLVADRRAGSSSATVAPVRRYRLARLQLDSRSTQPGARFEHLKRAFD